VLLLCPSPSNKPNLSRICGKIWCESTRSIKDLILQELDIFRPQFDAKKIRIETQFGKGADRVLADPDKIAQVVTNLLQNACQYTPAGGLVRIYSEQAPEEFKVIFTSSLLNSRHS